MRALWVAWGVSAAVMVGIATWAGWAATHRIGGILIDTRGRYSLTRLQVSLWTILVVSLLAGVLAARATVAGLDPLGFKIPGTVLVALGVSLGSGVVSIAIKAYKDRTRGDYVAASEALARVTEEPAGQRPPSARLGQIVLVEEGPLADEAVDVTKLQNLLFTLFLIGAYVVIAVRVFRGYGPPPPIRGPAGITGLPEFNATFLTLLVISDAAYLSGKLPNRGGVEKNQWTGAAEASRPRYSVTDRNGDLAAQRPRRAAAAQPARAASPRESGRELVPSRGQGESSERSPDGPPAVRGSDDLHRRVTLLEAEFAEVRRAMSAAPQA